MAALLLDIQPGDDVILPSFTFVSTVNAFVLRGARPVFADIRPDTLNLDEARLGQPLHLSPMGSRWGYQAGDCPVTEDVSDRLIRLPFYNSLSEQDLADVVSAVVEFDVRSA